MLCFLRNKAWINEILSCHQPAGEASFSLTANVKEKKKINTCHYSVLLQCRCFVEQLVPDGIAYAVDT